MDFTFIFNMKWSLFQVATSGEANKCQRLFTADEVLKYLDNSDDEQELNASYPDSELE